MIQMKVNKIFDFKGRQVGAPMQPARHNKPKNGRLLGGSKCRHYKNCFECPFKDCIDER